MSVYFNGTNYISLGEPSVLDFDPNSQEFTIMAWAYVSSGASGTIVGKRYSSGFVYQYQMGVDRGTGAFFVLCGTNSVATGSVDITGGWHHFTLMNFYLGGFYYFVGYVDAGLTDTTSSPVSGLDTSSAHVLIGARRGTDNTNYGYPLTGMVEDVRFYNRPIWSKELETIYYCRGNDKINYGLLGRFFLNEGYPAQTVSGTGSVKDESNEKNNGTATGSPTYDSTGLKRF